VSNFVIDPKNAVSRVPLRVRFGETDLMGIVHHGSYVLYFEAARVSWLRRRGVTYQKWAAAGIHLPVVDIEIQYKRPAKFEDELIVETTLSKVTAASLTFSYRILRPRAEGEARGNWEQPDTAAHEEILTTGLTRLACVNETHGVLRIPDEMKSVLVLAEDSRLTSMS
jgi:acyl-CoA thioester hydrolase